MSRKVSLIWLASYPKSGNTWLRFLLANAFWGPVTASAQIDRHIPDIHRQFPLPAIPVYEGRGFVKTHHATPATLPHRDISGGLIYVVRNPLDVASSLLHYSGVPVEAKASFIEHVIDFERSPLWRSFVGGAWCDHVTRWAVQDVGMPRLVLFYENMVADPAREFARILDFLGIHKLALDVDEAIRRSSFESLKALEAREVASGRKGFFVDEVSEGRKGNGWRFMRSGTIGSCRDDFAPDQIERAARRFSPVWNELLERHNGGRPIPLAPPAVVPLADQPVDRRRIANR
jgi:aryl sulfotransferase